MVKRNSAFANLSPEQQTRTKQQTPTTNTPNINDFISQLSNLTQYTDTIINSTVNPELKIALQHLAKITTTCGILLTQQQSISASDDEKERLRSVVISGVPESHLSANASQRRMENRAAVTAILDQLDMDTEPVSVYRMGTPKPDRPRLLKVVLPNSSTQRLLLKRSKQLSASQQHSKIYIRPSLTKEQRDSEFLLRKTLREKRALGEKVRIGGGPPGSSDRKIIPITGMNEENMSLQPHN